MFLPLWNGERSSAAGQRKVPLLLKETTHQWKDSDGLRGEGLSLSGVRYREGNQAWRQGLDDSSCHLRGVFVIKLNA